MNFDRSALLHAGVAAGWLPLLAAFFASAAGRMLTDFLAARAAAGARIYPPHPFTALALTPPDAVRVVILGQDPYHGAGQAHGLAFSVPAGLRLPPSLRNIDAELRADCGCALTSGDLGGWARQGVLLLNSVLTVEHGRPASHARHGWEALTQSLLQAVARDAAPKVFLLWGAQAQAQRAVVDAAGVHCVLAANHPSPLSARRPPRPFIGCRPFSQANAFLRGHGRGSIDWCA
jgi:uracil-DNA glycosylase